MRLTRLTIQNYKSLRNVEISPRDFSVLIGRNSSEKSNFADALEFLSIAYADGLEHPVARKGGYENIAHRKERRSRSAIGFSVELKTEIYDWEMSSPVSRPNRPGQDKLSTWVFRHNFELKASGEGIRSDFRITSEKLDIIKESVTSGTHVASNVYQWINIERNEKGKINVTGDIHSPLAKAVLWDARGQATVSMRTKTMVYP